MIDGSTTNGSLIQRIERQVIVPDHLAMKRLDVIASNLFPEFSRAKIQHWIRTGALLVDGQALKPREKLRGGEYLKLDAQLEEMVSGPEAIALNIIHEDEHILVINKPAGMVVHPGAGHFKGTLMNALLYHCQQLAALPRAGIVHRLDKDTTGLLVIAKTLEAHLHLTRQLADKTAGRHYEALVYGVLNRNGRIVEPIGRHPVHRTRMGVREDGREATTWYDVVTTWSGHSRLKLRLETGRTHQIRVHLQHIRHPIIGDPVYGGGFRQSSKVYAQLSDGLRNFGRQALHAETLQFVHPHTKKQVSYSAPLPEDMRHLIDMLDSAQGLATEDAS